MVIWFSLLRAGAGFNVPSLSNGTVSCDGADEIGIGVGALLDVKGAELRLESPNSEAEVRATAGPALAAVVRLGGGSLIGEEGDANRLEPPPSPGTEDKATAGATSVNFDRVNCGSLTGGAGVAIRLEPPPSSGAEVEATAVGVGVGSSFGGSGVAITLALPNPEAGGNAIAGDTFASDVTDVGVGVGVSGSSCGPPSRAGPVDRRDGVEAATDEIPSAETSDSAIKPEPQNASTISSTTTSTTGLPLYVPAVQPFNPDWLPNASMRFVGNGPLADDRPDQSA